MNSNTAVSSNTGFDNSFTGAVFAYSDEAMRGMFTLDDDKTYDAWYASGILTIKDDSGTVVASGEFAPTNSNNPDAPIRRGVLKTIAGTKVSLAMWKSYKKTDIARTNPFNSFGLDKPLPMTGCYMS